MGGTFDRRQFLGTAAAGTLAVTATRGSAGTRTKALTAASATEVPPPDKQQWQQLDTAIRGWWDPDLHSSQEPAIRADTSGTLLFLAFPYDTPGGTTSSFPEMYCWDSYFINRGLLAHGRLDLVRNHIRDYLLMAERYGFMPNGNRTYYLTRSQTPVFPDSVWRYYTASGDLDLLYQAYPLLKAEYEDYWNGPSHQTPTGLSTNRDSGDPSLPPQMASEAETGLDWTPIFNGDVRRCAPLITNCALVRYAQVLAAAGKEVGRPAEAARFAADAATRAALIRRYCWNQQRGLFVEYDYVAGQQLPYISDCAYWPLWAGIASADQARQLAANLPALLQPWGIAFTDQAYPDPYPAGEVSADNLQWMYPAGWPPMQLITVQGLDAYGYQSAASQVASRFLSLMLAQYQNTGQLWEKYNVADGSLNLPNARYGVLPLHGWTAATAVLLGRRIFSDQSLS